MKVEEQVNLGRYTTWHVGGPADFFARITSEADLREALQFIHEKQLPFFVLGKGSNTLFDDAGFRGVVLHMENRQLDVQDTTLIADSGVFMRPLVTKALESGLVGLEELAGIPGTVGGAVRGNAGTWQTETKDVLAWVDVLDINTPTAPLQRLLPTACEFSYRSSMFKKRPDLIIVRAAFELQHGDTKVGEALVEKDRLARHEKQPYDAPSAGSVFKNPDKEHGIFSGALIEQAGLKGKQVGGAQISAKHANFIINRDHATSADIKTLITEVQDTVKKQSGIDLEPEIVIL